MPSIINICIAVIREYVSLAVAAISEYAFRLGARLTMEVQKDTQEQNTVIGSQPSFRNGARAIFIQS